MKVREMIEALQEENPDTEVAMCAGNGSSSHHSGWHPVREIGSIGYEPSINKVVIDVPWCGL